jgi:hypothetical protein
MNTFARPADGAKDQKPKPKPKPKPKLKQDQKPDQEPLTLALSRRERELIAWTGRDTPTWDTELNENFDKPTDRPPLPPGEGWGEGKHHHKSKADHAALFTTQQDER